jgi:hypothetical protein
LYAHAAWLVRPKSYRLDPNTTDFIMMAAHAYSTKNTINLMCLIW